MSKGFSLDFDGFLDYARDLSNLGEETLKQAVDDAFTQSKDYVNNEIEKAMDNSKYHFDGTGYSKGRSKQSLNKIRQRPVEWSGTTAKAYIGVDLTEAPGMIFVMNGTPHMRKDTKLFNALKVKGNIKKEVEEIQKNAFANYLEGALND